MGARHRDMQNGAVAESLSGIGSSLEIIEENFLGLWIKVKLKSEPARLRTIRVDFNGKGFMETFAYQGVTINNIMLYAGPE